MPSPSISCRHSEIAFRAAATINSRGSVFDQWDKAGESTSSFTDGSLRSGLGSVGFVAGSFCLDMVCKPANVCLKVQRNVWPLIGTVIVLFQRSQISVAARESNSVEIFTDRDREFSTRREQFSNLTHGQALTTGQLMLELRPHQRFNVPMQKQVPTQMHESTLGNT